MGNPFSRGKVPRHSIIIIMTKLDKSPGNFFDIISAFRLIGLDLDPAYHFQNQACEGSHNPDGDQQFYHCESGVF